MKIEQLKRFDEAPMKGQVLAYTRKRVVFQNYKSHEEVQQLLTGDDIVELHMFDTDREYRSIVSESSRYDTGIIEWLEDFPDEAKTVYKEECLLENGGGSIIVLNHIRYDENGMAQVDTYRLNMGGEGNE